MNFVERPINRSQVLADYSYLGQAYSLLQTQTATCNIDLLRKNFVWLIQIEARRFSFFFFFFFFFFGTPLTPTTAVCDH